MGVSTWNSGQSRKSQNVGTPAGDWAVNRSRTGHLHVRRWAKAACDHDLSTMQVRPAILHLSHACVSNRRNSPGKERDTETGLDYFGARYYGSNMGRFTSPAPLGFTNRHVANPQKWNKYTYVTNNPLVLIDPDGEDDFYVFNTFRSNEAGYRKIDWAPIQKQAAANGHRVFVQDANGSTEDRMRDAMQSGGHVIVIGHGVESRTTGETYGILTGDNGVIGGGIRLGNGTEASTPSSVGPIDAQSVSLFGCDTANLDYEYSGPLGNGVAGAGTFTGVQSGPDGTTIGTLQTAGSQFVSTAVSSPNPDLKAAAGAAQEAVQQSTDKRDKKDEVVQRTY